VKNAGAGEHWKYVVKPIINTKIGPINSMFNPLQLVSHFLLLTMVEWTWKIEEGMGYESLFVVSFG
jgi:hypothetical protein